MERNRQRCRHYFEKKKNNTVLTQMRNPSLSKVVVRCKTSYTGLFSFLAIPLLMGDIMIEFMNMIDINGITTITLLVVIVLSPQLRS